MIQLGSVKVYPSKLAVETVYRWTAVRPTYWWKLVRVPTGERRPCAIMASHGTVCYMHPKLYEKLAAEC